MTKEKESTAFIFMGDPQCSRIHGGGSDYTQWGALFTRALRDLPGAGAGSGNNDRPLLVLGGDIVNRSEKHRDEEWEAFFDAAENAERAAGIAPGDVLLASPVTGAKESIGRYADRFINPGNGPVFHEKEFFSFDHGCCHFIVLNSGYMGDRDADACKFIGNWIKADLATNRMPAVFAVLHHPVYTLGTSEEDDVRAAGIRENYMRLLYRYGVDFLLCGHQHVYARTKAQDAEGQITQIMGVSGGKLFDARDKSSMAVVKEFVPVATLFETDGETIRLRTIDAGGALLDEYTQKVRPPKKRSCATCDNFSTCRGTGKYELLEVTEKALRDGDPLKPEATGSRRQRRIQT